MAMASGMKTGSVLKLPFSTVSVIVAPTRSRARTHRAQGQRVRTPPVMYGAPSDRSPIDAVGGAVAGTAMTRFLRSGGHESRGRPRTWTGGHHHLLRARISGWRQ